MYRFTIDVKIVSKKFTVKLQAKMSCESEQVLSQWPILYYTWNFFLNNFILHFRDFQQLS